MGDKLFLERFLWFHEEVKKGRYPNASTLKKHFGFTIKTAQRNIADFKDVQNAPLEYDKHRKGYYYTKGNFDFPITHLSKAT